MLSIFSLSKTSVKIRDSSSLKKSNKSGCILCKGEKNILTLECRHKYCVKCYNKTRYCIQCEKDNKKRQWCWCC